MFIIVRAEIQSKIVIGRVSFLIETARGMAIDEGERSRETITKIDLRASQVSRHMGGLINRAISSSHRKTNDDWKKYLSAIDTRRKDRVSLNIGSKGMVENPTDGSLETGERAFSVI